MSLNTDHIRLIFGLKLKQIRQEKSLSLSDLSARSGLSVSYINEIEKGKKYPKADKIAALAEALETDYDALVSLKLSKKLEPITQLLNSNFLTEIPFDFFGIDPASLLEMLADAPVKFSAFINTIIKIGRSYSMSVEQFYFAVLRSYQEMHDNNFPELEEQAANFLNHYHLEEDKQPDEFFLSNLLTDEYGITIKYFDEEDHKAISGIRSVFIPKSKTLLINKRISSDQRAFTMARELGFLYMNLKERPMTSSWIAVHSFDEIFNNFKASYFAGAVLIPRGRMVSRLRSFFELEKFSASAFQEMLSGFQATPETLLHRISNVLPDYFGINNIFFLRFETPVGAKSYELTKEMHLSKQHDPQESRSGNYCRRWVSLKVLDDLSAAQLQKKYTQPLIDIQVSDYVDADNKYLVLSVARPLNILEQTNVSVTLGFQIDQKLKETIKFLNDPAIPSMQVNQVCEKCSLFDCKERVAAPTILQKRRQQKEMMRAIAALK